MLVSGRKYVMSALVLLIGSACTETGPTVPQEMAPALAVGFGSAPAVLPNIFRTADGVAGWISDARTGLLVWGGLPADPSQSVECGGTEPFDLHEIQLVGLLRDELNLLATSRDVSLTVYELSSFTDICTTTPFAQGRGRITLAIRNDAMLSGTSTIAATLTGPVELSAGGTANMTAHVTILVGQRDDPALGSTVRLTRG